MKHRLIAASVFAATFVLAGQGPAGTAQPENRSKVASGDGGWEGIARKFEGSKADTKPSRDSTMAFTIPAEVREVHASGGLAVKKGDLLIRARDSDVVALVEGQKIQSESDSEVKANQLAVELADLKFTRLKDANNFSKAEFDDLRVQLATAKVQLEQARSRKAMEEKRLTQAEGQLERYRLEAPFDGVIEEVKVEVGQGVKESEPVVRVVNIDRMWLETYAPTSETIRLRLKEGSPAWVLVDLPDGARLVEGKVLYVSPVADSVSQTRRARVEIVNSEKWPAGIQARVRFTDPGSEWAPFRLVPEAVKNEAALGAANK
jgi:RND family efflux transporter MFP subunit